MDYITDLIVWLHSPELVSQIQEYFGVHKVLSSPSADSNFHLDTDDSSNSSKKHVRHLSNASCDSQASASSVTGWATAILSDGTVGGGEGCVEEEVANEGSLKQEPTNYVVTNLFWHTIFYLATKAGDEVFYIIFFPFWAWNVDGAVLRKTMFIWMVTLYVGQALKDVLKIPRPSSPPVVRLDPKWCLEYGMPSTHAMSGFAIPFSVVLLSVSRYQLPWVPCLIGAIFWCGSVCVSRIYLGMHSVLDIICGIILTAILMVVLLPCIDALDMLALSHPLSPLVSLTLTVAMIVCYPSTEKWTPARGDTTVIVGVGCGLLIGSWFNYQSGVITEPSILPPYTIIWPSWGMVGMSLLRTLLGLVLMISVRAIFKSLSFATICALLKVSPDKYKNKHGVISKRKRLVVELFYKFITYVALGFTIIMTAPLLFRVVGIERPTFYTEI